MLRVVSTNDAPSPADDALRGLVRAEIAESRSPRLTAPMVAEIILQKTGADLATLPTHGARLYLIGLAREELERSTRHERIEGRDE